MKIVIPILSLVFLISSCSTTSLEQIDKTMNCVEMSGIKICQDTLLLNIPGAITSGALYHNYYYLFFRDFNDQDKLGNQTPDKLYRISKDGEEIKEVKYPEDLESKGPRTVSIRNDSLIISTQRKNETYTLNDKTLTWKKVNDRPPLIYEDSEFQVSSNCHGEFGGIITFLDKKSGSYYDGMSTCAVMVNKLNNQYYVTNYLGHLMNSISIVRIDNPKKLHKRDEHPEKQWYSYLSKLTQGTLTLLDTFDLSIHSSFVYDDELYHIYSNDRDSTSTIGKLNNRTLSKQLKLDITPIFQHTFEGDNQFLTFYHSKDGFDKIDQLKFGIMEIIDGELRIHYINQEIQTNPRRISNTHYIKSFE